MSQTDQSINTDNSGTVLDLIEHVSRYARLLVFTPLLVGCVALAYSFTITPSFTATTRILPPSQPSNFATTLNSLGALGNFAGAAAGIKSPVDQYISFLYSETIQDRIIEKFNLRERYGRSVQEEVRKMLSGAVTAQSGKEGVIAISATDVDPKFAADLANAHVEQLTILLNTLATTEAQQRRRFFQTQLEMATRELVNAEIAVKSTGVDMSALRTNAGSLIQTITGAQERIAAQEVRVASMSAVLTSNSTELQQAQQELAALRAKLRQLTERTDGKESGDFINKFRDYKYREALVELYTRQFEAARVDEAREGGTIQVVDAAKPPTRKSQPKKGLIAVIATVATFSALMLYVLATFALRITQRRTDTQLQTMRVLNNLRRTVFLGPKT